MTAKTIADLAHSLGVSEKDVEDACIMRVRASFNACQGIPINALEADVVRRMRDTLKAALPFIDDAEDVLEFMSESVLTEECRKVVSEARALLAEIDEGGAA